jgi:hypothetical protein
MICWEKNKYECQGRARLRTIRGENVVLCDHHAHQYKIERYEIGNLLARHYNDDTWQRKEYPHDS